VLTFENIAIDYCNSCETMDLGGLFPRFAPLHIEVGSGKGTFLLNEARLYPDQNFLGIEWANKYYRYSVDRICRWGLENVRLLRTDAAVFLHHNIGDEVVDVFHVYFPDPWPKKRHHKRRFINVSNIKQMHRCLTRDGVIRMATDHADYYQMMRELFGDQEEVVKLFKTLGSFSADSAEAGESVGSNFERKYRKEGRDIYTLAVQKLV
jgi:tRNA (guanine-N7-)-methyltransferase